MLTGDVSLSKSIGCIGYSFFVDLINFCVEYINADDVIAFCLDISNEIR